MSIEQVLNKNWVLSRNSRSAKKGKIGHGKERENILFGNKLQINFDYYLLFIL
jgi:hypothetical protein